MVAFLGSAKTLASKVKVDVGSTDMSGTFDLSLTRKYTKTVIFSVQLSTKQRSAF